MDPTDALRSIETALRLVIRQVLGSDWLSAPGAPDRAKLEERRDEEDRRRDGAVVSSNLLEYTETYHLTELIRRNWDQFKPVFDDKKRTETYFSLIEDVRNSIAHSRDLVSFERNLISGIAGQLRNQVSLFRSTKDGSTQYYPLIESVKDQFGREGSESGHARSGPRIDVGTPLIFTGSAFNSTGKPIIWQIFRTRSASFAIDSAARRQVPFSQPPKG